MKTLADHLTEETAKHMAEALRACAGVHALAMGVLGVKHAKYYRKLRECRAYQLGKQVDNTRDFF